MEHPISKRITLEHEVGWVFDPNTVNFDEYLNKRGIKVREQLRYYLGRNRPSGIKTALIAELFYTGINYDQQEWFFVNCTDFSNCQFRQLVDFQKNRTIYGFNTKFGSSFYFKKHFMIDLNAGFGIRVRDVKTYGLPDQNGQFFIEDNDEWGFFQLMTTMMEWTLPQI